MKMRPPGFFPGKTEANTSTASATISFAVDTADSSYEEVRIATFVVFGGGFFVARSSSAAKLVLTLLVNN